MASKTYVVGCNHGIQKTTVGCEPNEVVEQRKHFENLLCQLVKDRSIGFIGEEWGCDTQTTAQRLACSMHVPWVNINTSLDDLDRLGIPRGYLNGNYEDSQKKTWNNQREDFMVGQIQMHQGPGTNALIICGFAHVEGLLALLVQDDVTPSKVDYRTMEWYRPTFTDDTPL